MQRLLPGYLLLIALAASIMVLSATAGQRPFLTYFTLDGTGAMAPAWTLPPLIWFGSMAVKMALRRTKSPSRTLLRMIRRHRCWLARGTFFTFLALPLGRAFGAFKASIPRHTTYWADAMFANLDRAFFGVDAWRITHALVGPLGTLVIDRLYMLWFLLMMALLGWLNFTRDPRLQLQGLLSYVLTWALLGMFGAMAFASVGPIFYDEILGGDRFNGLVSSLNAQSDLRMHAAVQYLFENRSREVIGGGISAMPSLHVGISWLFVLVCRKANKRLAPIVMLYAGVIYFGSVHLGWHYALDGIVSILGVSAIWWATGRFVKYLDSPANQT